MALISEQNYGIRKQQFIDIKLVFKKIIIIDRKYICETSKQQESVDRAILNLEELKYKRVELFIDE